MLLLTVHFLCNNFLPETTWLSSPTPHNIQI
jgi:hypothetical protein